MVAAFVFPLLGGTFLGVKGWLWLGADKSRALWWKGATLATEEVWNYDMAMH